MQTLCLPIKRTDRDVKTTCMIAHIKMQDAATYTGHFEKQTQKHIFTALVYSLDQHVYACAKRIYNLFL